MIITEKIFDDFLREKKLKGAKVSTLSNYSYRLKSIVLPCIGKIPNENDILCHMEQLQRSQANQTYLNTVILVNSFLDYLFRHTYINQQFKIPYPRKNEKRIYILSKEEQERLYSYITMNLDFFTFGLLLARYTGIRIGELAALKHCDIRNGILHIDKTLQRIKNPDTVAPNKTIVNIDTPKSYSSIRDIPLPAFLLELYNKLPNIQAGKYLLTNTDKFSEPRNIERRFQTVLRHIGAERKKFHILRHTFATECVRIGFDIKTLSEILGHSSVKITLEKYVHSDVELKEKNMNLLGKGGHEKSVAKCTI